MIDDLKTLGFALDKYPERVEALPVHRIVVDSARQNRSQFVRRSMNSRPSLISTIVASVTPP